MIRSFSNSRSWPVSTFLVASGAWRRNCPKRKGPNFRALTTIGFHLPSITSIAGLTGHSESRMSKTPVTKLCLLDWSTRPCEIELHGHVSSKGVMQLAIKATVQIILAKWLYLLYQR